MRQVPGDDELTTRLRKTTATPVFVAAVYCVAGLIWIFVTDLIVERWPAMVPTNLQTAKGTLFVLVTGFVLFTLLLRRDVLLRRGSEALRESESAQRALLEAAAEGIATLDATGHVTFMNRRLREILGLAAGEGGPLLERLDDESRPAAVEALRQVLGGSSRRVSGAIHATDGRRIDSELSMAPLPGRSGRIEGAVVLLNDVTERTAAERDRDRARAQLEESERLAALGRLASNLAHEFNNVLMGILPFVEVIQRLDKSDPRIEKATGSIVRSIERGRAITHDILGLTRLGTPKLHAIPAGEWLRGVADDLQREWKGTLEVLVDAADPRLTLCGDPDQLTELLRGVIRGARPESGGTVRVRVSAADAGHPPSSAPGGPFAHIEVEAAGRSIPDADLPHVFEPLFALKGGSSNGLALPLAHQIAANHGGFLAAENLGGATVFHLYLPIA